MPPEKNPKRPRDPNERDFDTFGSYLGVTFPHDLELAIAQLPAAKLKRMSAKKYAFQVVHDWKFGPPSTGSFERAIWLVRTANKLSKVLQDPSPAEFHADLFRAARAAEERAVEAAFRGKRAASKFRDEVKEHIRTLAPKGGRRGEVDPQIVKSFFDICGAVLEQRSVLPTTYWRIEFASEYLPRLIAEARPLFPVRFHISPTKDKDKKKELEKTACKFLELLESPGKREDILEFLAHVYDKSDRQIERYLGKARKIHEAYGPDSAS